MIKKYICPNCGETIEFDSKEKKDEVYCKKCAGKFLRSDVIKNTDKILGAYIQRGELFLYHQGKYSDAAEEYRNFLIYRENNFGALCGYITAKIYGSKISDVDFLLIKNEIEKREIVLNNENTFIFLSFIKDMLIAFKQFVTVCGNEIMKDNIFINEKYFDHYLKGLKDGLEILEYLNDAFEILEQEEFSDFKTNNPDFIETFNKIKNDFKTLLNKKYNVNKIGDVLVENGNKNILGTNVKSFEENNNLNLQIMRIEKTFTKQKVNTLVFYGLLIFVTLGLFIAYIITKNKIVGICELVVVAIGVIVYFILRKKKI